MMLRRESMPEPHSQPEIHDEKRVFIFDTTLRDGEQSPGAALKNHEKLQIAKQLAALNVDVIEAGFPFSSPGDFESVRQIAAEVEGPIICGLCRATPQDIEATWDAVKVAKRPRIHTFIATSDIHIAAKFKKSREEILNIATDMVALAASKCRDVEFSAEDAGRTDRFYLYKIVEAVIDAGATTVNIPDTVGYTIPEEFGRLIRDIVLNVPNIDKAIISVHCHNDLGLATANSLMGVLNGARQVECTINGIGERAGNAAMEEVVMALKVRPAYFENCYTNINTPEFFKTSQMVSELTGMPIQANKAIVGRNAFAHESGIHQDGFLKGRDTYEIMHPQDIGLDKSSLPLGPRSGKAALKFKLQELNLTVADADMLALFETFKRFADEKKFVTDEDIQNLVSGFIKSGQGV
jgi:2-isopropylmalate synthase